MKILFLTHRVPYPPDRGDCIRSFNFLRLLSRRHEIHLMSLCFGKIPEPDVKQTLEKYCRTVGIYAINYKTNMIKSIPYLFLRIPLTIPMFHSKELEEALGRRLHNESFDLIYIFSSSMAPYVIDVQGIPKIMDFIDVDSEKWYGYAGQASWTKRWLYSREARYLRQYEQKIEAACRASILATHEEVSLFKSFSPEASVFPIGNGVELRENSKAVNPPKKERIVFVGVMDYAPNVDGVKWFVNDIFPEIIRKKPGVEIVIVGKNPGREVRRLARETRNVHVTGHVNDVGSYLSASKVAIVPLRIARGIQNKILEAMAAGVPVVATTAAVKGLDAEDGVHFLLADDSQAFASSVLRLLEDEELNQRISENARQLVEKKYTWESKVEELEEIIECVAQIK